MKFNIEACKTIFDLIKNKTMPTRVPVRLRFFDGNTDITNTLFGFSYYELTSSVWSTPSLGEINNASLINLGVFQSSFYGSVTLKLYTSLEEEILEHTYVDNFVTGNSFIVEAGNFQIGLTALTVPAANALLNYLFKGVTSGIPTTWWLEISDNAYNPYQARIALNPDAFGEALENEIGELVICYGEYLTIPTTSTESIVNARFFDSSSNGVCWFNASMYVPSDVYTGRIVEIANNSLVFSIPPETYNSTFLLDTDNTCIFYVNFDGYAKELCSGTYPVEDTVDYAPIQNMFNTECAVLLGSDIVAYENVNLPTTFTLELFVKFSNDPVNRRIIFFEKQESIKLEKTSANNLVIYDSNIAKLTTAWSPVVNTWYHIFITKNSTALTLRVNNTVDVSVGMTDNFSSNTELFRINNSDYPVLGYCNLLAIYNTVKTFNNQQKPLPSRRYDWEYISPQVWHNMSLIHWQKYCG